jgi:hypothetical protein
MHRCKLAQAHDRSLNHRYYTVGLVGNGLHEMDRECAFDATGHARAPVPWRSIFWHVWGIVTVPLPLHLRARFGVAAPLQALVAHRFIRSPPHHCRIRTEVHQARCSQAVSSAPYRPSANTPSASSQMSVTPP